MLFIYEYIILVLLIFKHCHFLIRNKNNDHIFFLNQLPFLINYTKNIY